MMNDNRDRWLTEFAAEVQKLSPMLPHQAEAIARQWVDSFEKLPPADAAHRWMRDNQAI